MFAKPTSRHVGTNGTWRAGLSRWMIHMPSTRTQWSASTISKMWLADTSSSRRKVSDLTIPRLPICGVQWFGRVILS